MNAALRPSRASVDRLSSAELTSSDFNKIAGLVRKACGIDLSEGKLGLVKSRLQKRLRALQLNNYPSYIELVQSPEGAQELEELICAITTNVTAFNREPHHFVHFREKVMPALAEKLRRGDSIRIWSAGCSNGSEAHTLACTALEVMPDLERFDLRILATDIDKYSLDVGRHGLYGQNMISKLQPEMLSKWFVKSDAGYQIDDKPRALVSFKTLNLMAPWPFKKKYDVIFCRNTLIYFTYDDQVRLFTQFTDLLKEKAIMYIGHSERVVGPAQKRLNSIGGTTYCNEPPELG